MKDEELFGQADHLRHELMYLFPFEDASSAAKQIEVIIINRRANKESNFRHFNLMKTYVTQTQQATS